MFEVATVTNPTLGRLAEALLFYGKVELIADYSTIGELAKKPGLDVLFPLIDSGQLTIHFSPKMLGVRMLGLEMDPISIELVGAEKKLNTTQHLIRCLTRQLGDDKEVRRMAIKVGKLVDKPKRVAPIVGDELNPFLDPEITTALALGYLKEMSPTLELASDKYFRLVRGKRRYLLDTNLDFAKLGLQDLSGSHIDEKRVFLAIHTATRDLALTTVHEGDFFCPSLSSQFIQRYRQKRSGNSSARLGDIESFNEIVLPEHRSVRNVIDAGGRNFSDFMKLYEQASKFKAWVLGKNNSAELAREYFEAVSKVSWYESPIARTVRLIIPAAVGIVAPPVGIVASVADAMVAKKLQPARHPRLFVEGPLSEFVDNEGRQRWPSGKIY